MRPAWAAAAGLGGILTIAGCGDDDSPAGAGLSARRYTVAVLEASLGTPPVPGAVVEANTSFEIYSMTTDASGVAILTIPGNVPLPDSTILTIDQATVLPHAVVVNGRTGATSTASPVCTPAAGRVLTRIPRLHRLGDGVADRNSGVVYQIPVEEAEIEIQFTLTQVPSEMPSFRLQARGIEAPAELYLNGLPVGTLPAAADDRLRTYLGVLKGVSTSHFIVGVNSFRVEASSLENEPGNVDDFEMCAFALYRP